MVFERIENDTWNAVGGEIEINQWSHIVGTFDGTTMNLYVNGQIIDTGTFGSPVSLPDSSQDLQIAGDDGDFAGSIDDVAIYTRALSQDAVRLHYGEHQLYDYDDLYRLTGVTYGNGDDVTYTYDGVGNRTTMVTGAGTTQYDYDAADRISSVTPPGASAINYTWDDNGTLTARGSDSFGWNAAERLTSATVDSLASSSVYNGDGLRDSVTYFGYPTTYTWDVNRLVPQVLDDEVEQYLYGLGRISQVESTHSHYYLTDGLGSTLALTDESGDVSNAYEYDVFGAVRSDIGRQYNEHEFTGEQADFPTALEYLRARYYDMGTGTFLSRDPLAGVPDSQGHPFAYVDANPQTLLDPLGLEPGDHGPPPVALPPPGDYDDSNCYSGYKTCIGESAFSEEVRNSRYLDCRGGAQGHPRGPSCLGGHCYLHRRLVLLLSRCQSKRSIALGL